MNFLHGMICLFFFSFLYSSDEDRLHSKKIIESEESQNLLQDWVESFKKFTNPNVTESLFHNPYDESVPHDSRFHVLNAMQAKYYYHQTFNPYFRQAVDDQTALAVIKYRQHYKDQLGIIDSQHKEMMKYGFLADDTTIDQTTISDMTSNSGSDTEYSSQASSIQSVLVLRQKQHNAMQLMIDSHKIYDSSLQAQQREIDAQEVIDRYDFQKKEAEKKSITQHGCNNIVLSTVDAAVIQVENEKKAALGMSKFQAVVKGRQLRNQLASIQWQHRYRLESLEDLKKQNELAVQKHHDQTELVRKNLVGKEKRKNKADNKNKYKQKQKRQELQGREQQRKEEQAEQKAIIREQEREREISVRQIKNLDSNISLSMSEDEFKAKLASLIAESMSSLSCPKDIQNNIATRTIYKGALHISDQVHEQYPEKMSSFNKRTIFSEVINPTFDQENLNRFKQSSLIKKLNLSNKDAEHIVNTQKMTVYATLCWKSQNTQR